MDNDFNIDEYDEFLRELDIELYGVDLRKLKPHERREVEATTKKRWDIESELNRRKYEAMSEQEKEKFDLETRILELELEKVNRELDEFERN